MKVKLRDHTSIREPEYTHDEISEVLLQVKGLGTVSLTTGEGALILRTLKDTLDIHPLAENSIAVKIV